MDIKYTIKHIHTRYVAYKNDIELGVTSTKDEAQKIIDEDKMKWKQFLVTWLSKTSDLAQFMEIEAKDETQVRIKVQQLHMDDLAQILKVERI